MMEWARESDFHVPLMAKLENATKAKIGSYKTWYNRQEASRYSVSVDRVMGYLDRRLFAMRYLHGHWEQSRLLLRGWAQIYNFSPWNPATIKKNLASCPAERLNGFRYRDDWLENFVVASLLRLTLFDLKCALFSQNK
jgi:hypothetical protein